MNYEYLFNVTLHRSHGLDRSKSSSRPGSKLKARDISSCEISLCAGSPSDCPASFPAHCLSFPHNHQSVSFGSLPCSPAPAPLHNGVGRRHQLAAQQSVESGSESLATSDSATAASKRGDSSQVGHNQFLRVFDNGTNWAW